MSQNTIQSTIPPMPYRPTNTQNSPNPHLYSIPITYHNNRYLPSPPLPNSPNYIPTNQPQQYKRQIQPSHHLYINNYQTPQVQVYSNINQYWPTTSQYKYQQKNGQKTNNLSPQAGVNISQEQENAMEILRPAYNKRFSTRPNTQLGKNYAPQTDPVEMDRNKKLKMCFWIMAALFALLCISIGVLIGLGLLLGSKFSTNQKNNQNLYVVSDIKPKVKQLGNTTFQIKNGIYTSYMLPVTKVQPIDQAINQEIEVVKLPKNQRQTQKSQDRTATQHVHSLNKL